MFEDALRVHKALADETRLRIVHLLELLGELCVCDVETALEITQSKASRHMSALKAAGLLADRRDGTWVYYRVPERLDGYRRRVVAGLVEAVAGSPELAGDAQRAEALRRSPRCGAR